MDGRTTSARKVVSLLEKASPVCDRPGSQAPLLKTESVSVIVHRVFVSPHGLIAVKMTSYFPGAPVGVPDSSPVASSSARP